MASLDALSAALAWIGRQGTRAIAASVFVGLALPPLAAFLKPVFTESMFVLITLAFLRVAPADIRRHMARPVFVLGAIFWIMIAVPLVSGAALWLFDIAAPGLLIALMFQAMAPPIMSSPALAALMGLDVALSLVTLIACTALAPFTAALFAAIFLGPVMAVSAGALGLKLLAMLAGAALVAAAVRRVAGQAWIDRQTERIDGLNVIALFVFAVAIMDGVLAQILANPLLVAAVVALAFAIAIGLGAITALVFRSAGRADALTLAVSSGGRNLGLMVAAAGGLVPDFTWLYVAIAQFPIYLLPMLLKPLVQKLAPIQGEVQK